jgi:peptidyl-prolyl cis-trans isomerase SurA
MIQQKLKEGEDFAELATKYSEGPSAKYGGNLGFVNLDDLNNPEFAKAASKLEVGEVSPPVLTDFGYHLIKLEGKKDGELHLRHILVKAEEGTAERNAARELADSLRSVIKGGGDFADIAARFSDDENSRSRGGLVGEVPVANLPDFFKDAIRNVKPEGLAPVIKDDKGFRVIKVIDRHEPRPFTFSEAREELKNVLRRDKMQQKYSEYVESLKKKYYVDIKKDVMQ